MGPSIKVQYRGWTVCPVYSSPAHCCRAKLAAAISLQAAAAAAGRQGGAVIDVVV